MVCTGDLRQQVQRGVCRGSSADAWRVLACRSQSKRAVLRVLRAQESFSFWKIPLVAILSVQPPSTGLDGVAVCDNELAVFRTVCLACCLGG
jgi:hypothetical protein